MHDDLDKLIDGALSAYSNAEPLAGLEQRVLQKVRAAEAARKRRWWWAVLALAAPALAAIFFFAPARQPRITAPVAIAPPPPAPVPVAPAPPSVEPPRTAAVKPRRAAPARPLPKKPMFPTRSPLTREERLLVAVAASHPQLLMARPPDEIAIKPIEIAPLNLDGNH